MKCELGETNPPNPHNPPPNGSADHPPVTNRSSRNGKDQPIGAHVRYTGQYHAGTTPGPRMQDIGADARRAGVRTAVGTWELEQGYEYALAADDERDHRRAIRNVFALPEANVSGAATDLDKESFE